MKYYPELLHSIDIDFEKALQSLKNDPLFWSRQTIYTTDDKRRIALLWEGIIMPFLSLRHIIRSLYWRSFFTLGSKNCFVVKYAAIITYYNMLFELRSTFWPHEEFLRQYLDDTFQENYSTLARYMYHTRFIAVLLYPREYFLSLKDEVNISLSPLFERDEKAAGSFEQRLTLDGINIYYHLRYKLGILFTWIAKYGGRLMMHIHFSRRKEGLIRQEHIDTLLLRMRPWDILLTRQNWAATNLNIPGFWKHMAMYVGTGEFLIGRFPELGKLGLNKTTHYIIEAIGLWVQIIPIELLCGHNDYLGVIRTRFRKEKIERAIEKTIHLIGTNYDYSFNYYSDINYVCSTLVTKAYQPESNDDEWIHITLTRIGIWITYPPNDIVKKMKAECNSPEQELDFVWFIDSIERTGMNFLWTEEAFLSTWTRSKLSIFLP